MYIYIYIYSLLGALPEARELGLQRGPRALAPLYTIIALLKLLYAYTMLAIIAIIAKIVLAIIV